MKKSLFILLVFLIAGAAALYLLDYQENPYRFYERSEESLYRGEWVPRYFPDDILEVHEQHDIDTNEVWVRFTLGKQDYVPASHGYGEVHERNRLQSRLRGPFSHGWWFTEAIFNDTGSTRLFSGPCDTHEDSLSGRQGFVLTHGNAVYWWCQYI